MKRINYNKLFQAIDNRDKLPRKLKKYVLGRKLNNRELNMKIKNYTINFETSNRYTRLYWGSLLPAVMYVRDVSYENDYTITSIRFLFLKYHFTIKIIKNIENSPF